MPVSAAKMHVNSVFSIIWNQRDHTPLHLAVCAGVGVILRFHRGSVWKIKDASVGPLLIREMQRCLSQVFNFQNKLAVRSWISMRIGLTSLELNVGSEKKQEKKKSRSYNYEICSATVLHTVVTEQCTWSPTQPIDKWQHPLPDTPPRFISWLSMKQAGCANNKRACSPVLKQMRLSVFCSVTKFSNFSVVHQVS